MKLASTPWLTLGKCGYWYDRNYVDWLCDEYVKLVFDIPNHAKSIKLEAHNRPSKWRVEVTLGPVYMHIPQCNVCELVLDPVTLAIKRTGKTRFYAECWWR